MAKKLQLGQPPFPNRKKYPFVATVRYRGLVIDVENLDGSTRTGKDPNGKTWSTKFKGAHYGEIQKSKGSDGDLLDVHRCHRLMARQAAPCVSAWLLVGNQHRHIYSHFSKLEDVAVRQDGRRDLLSVDSCTCRRGEIDEPDLGRSFELDHSMHSADAGVLDANM